VLDEAPIAMLDMALSANIQKNPAPAAGQKRQNLLFSATFNPSIRKLAHGCCTSPCNCRPPLKTGGRLLGGAGDCHPLRHGPAKANLNQPPESAATTGKAGGWFSRNPNTEPNRLADRPQSGRHQRHGHPRQKSQGARTPRPGRLQNRRDARAGGHRPGRPRLESSQLPPGVNLDLPTRPKIMCTGSAGPAAPARSGHALSLGGQKTIELLRADRKGDSAIPCAPEVPGFEPPSHSAPPLDPQRWSRHRAAASGGAVGSGGQISGGPAGRCRVAAPPPAPFPSRSQPSSRDQAAAGGAEAGTQPYGLPRNSKLCSSTEPIDEGTAPRLWVPGSDLLVSPRFFESPRHQQPGPLAWAKVAIVRRIHMQN